MNFFGNQDPAGGFFTQFGINPLNPGGMPPLRRANPRSYDEYMKAYSMAMLPGRERENVSYGGKVIMPPSALAALTNLDLESPWMFKLRNPTNPAAQTHCGVLEFIAEEGCVHLPYWMMKSLRLNEGDPIRITGTELPKGKLVKLQAQSVHFLEISDHKAVLERALRNFAALTQGDIIEISYNSIVFGLLVMETSPGGEGINVIDTDLEVDFAPPVGYVEPERPKPAPPSTMASKLGIDTTSSTPGSSRPTSALGGGFAGAKTGATVVSKGGDQWESFKGQGQTLGGRRTKGKGISHRPAEQVVEGSKIIRTNQHKIVSNDTLQSDKKVPAPLRLPFGKLFFGFSVAEYQPPPESSSSDTPDAQPSFSGAGNSLTGKKLSTPASSSSIGKGKQKEEKPEKSWGAGHTLSSRPSAYTGSGSGAGSSSPSSHAARGRSPPRRATGAGGASVPSVPVRRQAPTKMERSPTPDWGVDSDEDVIMIDSD